MLSVRARVVRSFTTKHWATQSLWTTPPASSNSELLTVLWGFVQLTRDSTIPFGKGMRHTMGCAPVGLGGGRAALGCGGNVIGVAVGPGSTMTPHIYPEAYALTAVRAYATLWDAPLWGWGRADTAVDGDRKSVYSCMIVQL